MRNADDDTQPSHEGRADTVCTDTGKCHRMIKGNRTENRNKLCEFIQGKNPYVQATSKLSVPASHYLVTTQKRQQPTFKCTHHCGALH